MRNFEYIAGKLKEAEASFSVQDKATLSAALDQLLNEPETISRLADAAGKVADAEASVLDRLMDELQPILMNVLPGDLP